MTSLRSLAAATLHRHLPLYMPYMPCRLALLKTACFVKLQAGAETGNQLLACAASGNSAFNSDILPMYPAAYKLDNIISVGATAQSDAMASYSNFGR